MVPSPATIAASIAAKVPFSSVPGTTLLIREASEALAAAWGGFERGLQVATLPVLGGTAIPGGPLVGGRAQLSPGSLQATVDFGPWASGFTSSFLDPTNVSLLVRVLAATLTPAFGAWVSGFSATLEAIGGSVAWVASPTPAPGPWTQGQAAPLPLTSGSSSGEGGMAPAALTAAALGALTPPLKVGPEPTPAMRALIQGIWEGFSENFATWKGATRIQGGSGQGTGTPPNGAISPAGTLTGLLVG